MFIIVSILNLSRLFKTVSSDESSRNGSWIDATCSMSYLSAGNESEDRRRIAREKGGGRGRGREIPREVDKRTKARLELEVPRRRERERKRER